MIPLFIFRADLDPAALPVICDPHKDRPVSLLQRERRASACARGKARKSPVRPTLCRIDRAEPLFMRHRRGAAPCEEKDERRGC